MFAHTKTIEDNKIASGGRGAPKIFVLDSLSCGAIGTMGLGYPRKEVFFFTIASVLTILKEVTRISKL